MFIDIKVKNFKSIKGVQSFSMLSRKSIKELPSNTFSEKNFNLLKSSIIYGANGSGKSNLIEVFAILSHIVSKSDRYKSDSRLPYMPFEFESGYEKKPTEIEINFIAKNRIRYSYSISFNENEFLEEKLYYFPGKNPAKLFIRKKGTKTEYSKSIRQVVKNYEKTLYDNQLLLSKVGTEKIADLIPVYEFLTRHFSVYHIQDSIFEDGIIQMFTRVMQEKNKSLKDNIVKLIQVADLGVRGLNIAKSDLKKLKLPESMSEEEKKEIYKKYEYEIKSIHDNYSKGKKIGKKEFEFRRESTGTIKLLGVGAFILEALRDGDLIVVDELDKSLHPFITKLLVQIVHSKKTNPFNAQLIFASHDISLLNNRLFRRDQIQFSEKKYEGDSYYYSLGDMKGVRKDLPYEKYYFKGMFGGVPLINEYDLEFNFKK